MPAGKKRRAFLDRFLAGLAGRTCHFPTKQKRSLLTAGVVCQVAHDIGALAVCEKGKDVVTGVFSERDYLKKVTA